MEVLQTLLIIIIVLLRVSIQSSLRQVLFQSLVRLASLPHSELDLIKCSRSDLGKLYLLGLVTES